MTQTGGSTTVSIAEGLPHLAAFGFWTSPWSAGSAAPTSTPPTVTGIHLTPTASSIPVYRFDVTGASFSCRAARTRS